MVIFHSYVSLPEGNQVSRFWLRLSRPKDWSLTWASHLLFTMIWIDLDVHRYILYNCNGGCVLSGLYGSAQHMLGKPTIWAVRAIKCLTETLVKCRVPQQHLGLFAFLGIQYTIAINSNFNRDNDDTPIWKLGVFYFLTAPSRSILLILKGSYMKGPYFQVEYWLVVSNMAFIFHNIWDVILPID